MAMCDILALPTLLNRLLADCLADVADGNIARVGLRLPTPGLSSPIHWSRRGTLTWIDAVHAPSLIRLQRPIAGWIIQPGISPSQRLAIGKAIMDHCRRHALPPLICMPRLMEDTDTEDAEGFLAEITQGADHLGRPLATARIVETGGFVVCFATQTRWSRDLTTRLASWQQLERTDVLI